MRHWIYAASASLVLRGAAGQANAVPINPIGPAAIPSDIEQAQFIFGGRNYCWYDNGWRGAGFYWCGYAFRRGLGWGDTAGCGPAAADRVADSTAVVVRAADMAVAVVRVAVDTVVADMAAVDMVA